ncbi:MAG: type I methionyl aminopeptidase [Oscillospiraceae bacterium]|nr:type I methionyl aminopeptidase [Oscillospiraceae bacterium]
MIPIKNEQELRCMRKACRITAAARALAGEMVRPGVSTLEIDKAVHDYIVAQGATPSFLGYGGFPASSCISVNEVVIHGIPDHRVLKEGDIVSVDVGAYYEGFHGDCAETFACGEISPFAQKLIDVTRQSFYEGIQFARQGNRVSDIGHAIQAYVESNGFSVVRSFVGHGVGANLHEEPEVPNFGAPGRGPRLFKGMTLAVEPMVCAGHYAVNVLKDRWTVVTADGSLAAHYENTFLITDGEPEILTVTDNNSTVITKEVN